MEKATIKLSIFFPGGEDNAFDMEYYLNNHMPLAEKLLGDAVKQVTVERGISGGAPGSMAPYIAVAGYFFDTMEALNLAFEPVARELLNDLVNFTDSKPLLCISEVMK